MPWRLDTQTRTDEIVAAVYELVAVGGVAAVSYRAIALKIRLSHSTLHGHFPDRAHLLKIVAFRMSRKRLEQWSESIRVSGLGALVPDTEEDLKDSIVWLAMRDLARTEPMLTHVMAEARIHELNVIYTALEACGVPFEVALEVAEPLFVLLEGLESACTLGDDPMTSQRARELLEQVGVALTGTSVLRPMRGGS